MLNLRRGFVAGGLLAFYAEFHLRLGGAARGTDGFER